MLASGRICCPVNPRWSERELQHALDVVQPTLLLHHTASDTDSLPSTLSSVRCLRVPEDALGSDNEAVAAITQLPEDEINLNLAAPACATAYICFTSGTSAAAKGVAISHAALHAQSLAKLATVGYATSDVYLHSSPLFHVGAQLHMQRLIQLSAALACRKILFML